MKVLNISDYLIKEALSLTEIYHRDNMNLLDLLRSILEK